LVDWDAGTREPLTLGSGTPVSPWLSAQVPSPLRDAVPVLRILDDRGRLLDGNGLAIEGCGFIRDEVIGRPFWTCGWWSPDPDLAHRVHEWCRRAVLTGSPLRTRSRFFRGDGTRRMVDLALSPVHARDGATSFLVATGLDVTDALATQTERERRLAVETSAMRGLTLAVSDRLGEHAQVAYRRLALDSPLPAAHVVRTGRPLVLPDRRAGLALTPDMARVYERTQRHAWAVAPLVLGRRVLGSLAVSWVEERRISADEMGLIEAFAAQCAQALARIQVTVAPREATLAIQRVNESLERSLLTRPPTAACLDIAVRYLPAVQDTQVGGDWYEAFQLPDGATLVSVGDVAGHNGDAAATMAQLRNLLRGLAVDSRDGPASLLSRLDRAVARLGLGALATAVVVVVRPQASGACVVEWASAGHLPPLVRRPDGQVVELDGEPDVLIGLEPTAARREQLLELPAGSTLLLYTDGLVERRGESLDDGCARLAAALAAVGSAAPEEVCDRLLGAALDQAPEDDVAMLVLRPRACAEAAVPDGSGAPGVSDSA
jgi:PAS domain S-box-containing protein